jgi:hypothetical protein
MQPPGDQKRPGGSLMNLQVTFNNLEVVECNLQVIKRDLEVPFN